MILCSVAVFLAAACSRAAEAGVREREPRAAEEHGANVVSVVLAPRQRAVLSAEVTSTVAEIAKEMRESFRAGDSLLQLDATLLAMKEREARAVLASTQAALAQIETLAAEKTEIRRAEAVVVAARANLEATESLYKEKQASRVQLESARRDLCVAEADRERAASSAAPQLAAARKDVALAEGALAVAAHQVQACRVQAPYAGHVVRVLVQAHERVEPGTPLIEIVDDAELLAKFLLPARLFNAVQLGQAITLRVRETGADMQATVSRVSAVLDAASMTFEVHARIDNRDGRLCAGMNATLMLTDLGKGGDG